MGTTHGRWKLKRPFEVSHLDHLVLRTTRLQEMADFYVLLGGYVARDVRSELGMLQIQLGRSMIDLIDVDDKLGAAGGSAPQDQGRNLDHFAVRIEPFDEASILSFCAQHDLSAQALPFNLYGADGLGPAVYVSDPDGNKVELKGPPEA